MASWTDRIQLALGRKARDPVCGMVIRRGDAVGTSEVHGRTYYFCAAGCKAEFDEAPERFV